MKKKHIIITAVITAVAIFVLTTLFYITPIGKLIYFKTSSAFGGSDFSKLMYMEKIIDSSYIGEYDKELMAEYAASGYAAGVGDVYTNYLSAADYASMQESLDGGYCGIGVQVTAKDGKIYVDSISEGGPAQEAGMRAGDYLISVNGTQYSAEQMSEATAVIKSTPAGEKVDIVVEREGTVLELEITVKEIDMEYVSWKMLDSCIGYIKIQTFGTDIYERFKEGLDELESQGMKGMIIDVRSNPGGSLDTVTQILDLLLPEGVITTIKYKDGSEEEYTSDADEIDVPMCVLINEESASASEILAGALQDFRKAVLVGKKTYGKGVVQGVYDLGDGSALRVTIAKYYTPAGVCIDGIGIMPDCEVDLPQGVTIDSFTTEPTNDSQLAKAVELLTQ